MKKVLLISIVIALVALTGCVYSPATHVPTAAEQAALDILANDTTATVETVDCVILEAVNAEWKNTYVDTAANFAGVDTNFTNLFTAAAVIDLGSTEKTRVNMVGSYLAGYAKISVTATTEIDIYMDIHGAIKIWDTTGETVEYDTYGMSPACAMVFKGTTSGSVVREHYTFTLDAGDYYVRFTKAENATYKSRNYFYAVIN